LSKRGFQHQETALNFVQESEIIGKIAFPKDLRECRKSHFVILFFKAVKNNIRAKGIMSSQPIR
jgi:hypothetical protein